MCFVRSCPSLQTVDYLNACFSAEDGFVQDILEEWKVSIHGDDHVELQGPPELVLLTEVSRSYLSKQGAVVRHFDGGWLQVLFSTGDVCVRQPEGGIWVRTSADGVRQLHTFTVGSKMAQSPSQN